MANKNKTNLRDVSVPLLLQLDETTHLPSTSEFTSFRDEDIKHLKYINYSPIKFKNDTVTFEIRVAGDTQMLQVTINENHLMVSCDCKAKAPKLCRHLIKFFTELLEDKKHNYFDQFKVFPFNDPVFYDKYLMIGKTHWWSSKTEAIPRPEFGKIYKYGDDINVNKISPLSLTTPPSYREEDAESNSLIFVLAGLYANEIPFMLPCLVKYKPDSDEILNFLSFQLPENISAGKNITFKALIAYCEDFNQLIGFNKKPSEHRSNEGNDDKRIVAFNLWKCLVPNLLNSNVYYYSGFDNKVDFKSKPKKSYMEKITFSFDKTHFTFVLQEFDGYFRLVCSSKIADRQIKIKFLYPRSTPFFFTTEDCPSTYHQFASLEEANIIHEFHKSDYGFTIQSKDLELFNREILATIAVDYPVEYQILSNSTEIFLKIIEKRILLEDHGNYVSFNPMVYYNNGSCFSVLTNGQSNLILKENNVHIMHRDKVGEDLFKSAFIELHPVFSSQLSDGVLYLSKDLLSEDQWLAKCQYLLPDVTFVGIEKILNLNLHIGEPTIATDVSQKGDWFDITVSVKFGNEILQPEEIQKALKKKSPVTVLSNGKVAYLPDEFFNKLSKAFRAGIITSTGVKVPSHHYTIVDTLFDKLAKPNLAKSLSEITELFTKIETTSPIDVPENVNAILRGYQKIGFTWLTHLYKLNWGGLLADDMGLGKTLQILTLLQYLKNNEYALAPHLLLAPTSLLFNWKEEAEKFCPELNVLFFHGFSREKNVEQLNKYDLIITSYGTSSVDIEFLMKMNFHYLILDEAQAIKNPYSQRYKTTMLIPADNRIALTGTPVENSTTDLYAIMNFINPGFFGTLKMFKDNLLPSDNNDDLERNDTIADLIRPFILRRTKKQVANDLPPKTEMILWCEMETEQRKIYDNYRKLFKENLVERIDNEGLERSKFYVLEGLMKLRQICNSPLLMKNAPPFHGTSCKIKALMEHISENSLEHKLLVFSQFTSMLSLVRNQLERQSISYCYLDGKTPPLNRKKEVDTFQNDQSIKIFLISLKAGGAGLNLTAADYVYLLDPWWNPAKEDQAIDRCYRIGQDKHVMAYKVICKDTLEERILDMQQRKKRLAEELIPTDENILRTMGKEEILGLLD